MDIPFKIYFEDLEKVVFLKGDLISFKNYKLLRDTLIDKSKMSSFKRYNKQLSHKDIFILEIKKDIQIDNLPSIFNQETLDYLIGKIELMDKKEIKLYFTLKKVTELPKWTPPDYFKILQYSLRFTFQDIKENLLANFICDKNNLLSDKENINYSHKINKNIICNKCLQSNFYGLRYVCAECNNFNLCNKCYKQFKYEHNEDHLLIKINQPIDIDLNYYNNQFINNNIVINEFDKSIEIDVKILNTGLNDLINCFIVPIRYGNNYFSCDKFKINESLKNSEIKEIKLNIKLSNLEEENNNNDNQNLCKGKFRMFTEQGLPFGDILNIHQKFK